MQIHCKCWEASRGRGQQRTLKLQVFRLFILHPFQFTIQFIKTSVLKLFRVMLDSLTTLLVWTLAMAVGWQNFAILHFICFGLLMIGTSFYIFDENLAPAFYNRNSVEDQNKEKLWTAGQINSRLLNFPEKWKLLGGNEDQQIYDFQIFSFFSLGPRCGPYKN